MLVAGPRNRKGADGIAGKDGKDGTNGEDGLRGSLWTSDEGKPKVTDALENDQYLDTKTGDVYQYISSKWVLTGNIKGPKGKDGKSGPRGPQGQQGDPGTNGTGGDASVTIIKTAGETISAGKAVYLDSFDTVKLSDHSVLGKQYCVGIAITAATLGNDITVQTDGVFEDSIFSGFTINNPFWVGINGSLTQTAPASGVLLEAGYYLGQNKIEIEIQRRIILA